MAEPKRVIQSGDTALIVSDQGISVVRRSESPGWRFAIVLLDRLAGNGGHGG